MKKIFSVLLTVTMIFTAAYAYPVEIEECYFFGGERYYVSMLDTDGSMFSGVINNRLAVSRDFENWDVVPDTRPVHLTVYLDGSLRAVGTGYTYIYNGTDWQTVSNNLPGEINTHRVIKNGGSLVAYVTDCGTYQTYDGVTWNKVENIPENLPMYKIDDKIIFFSHGYMRGLYYSDAGESFTKHEFADFTESAGNGIVSYYDGMYHIQDYATPVEDENYNIHRFSADLENWQSELVLRDGEKAQENSHYVNIRGELHSLSQNGDDMVYTDGKWVKGKYNMNLNITPNAPFVFYNFSDFGIFAWSNDKYAFFISNDGEMKTLNGRQRQIMFKGVKDGAFYVCAADETVWRSENGMDWIKTDEKYDFGIFAPSTEGTNGSVTLKSEFIERGSRAFHPDNPEITAVITYPGGTAANVAYEYAKGDCVTVIGTDGFFLLGGFDTMGSWYYSPDGITRVEKIDLPSNVISNGKTFLYTDTPGGFLRSGDLAQFKAVTPADSILVKLNDEFLSFAAAPVVTNGRTLVPIRFLFERAGAEVDWDDETKTAAVSYGETTVSVTVDSTLAYVNGEEKQLDTAARLINDKTMIPLRFISEQLGFDVQYNEAENTAYIYSPGLGASED